MGRKATQVQKLQKVTQNFAKNTIPLQLDFIIHVLLFDLEIYVMRVFLLVILLGGCTLNTPISQFDSGIAEICTDGKNSYTHEGNTRQFTVLTSDDPDQIYNWCGPDAQACTNGLTVWLPSGPTCPSAAAHEMNHLFDQHYVDGPSVRHIL